MVTPIHETPTLKSGDGLVLIDVQKDFIAGGALAVPQGDEVIPVLNQYIAAFRKKRLAIFASRDWHPADHHSFEKEGGPWPVHCVQGSRGAQYADNLKLPPEAKIISTGYRPELEGYSAFEETGFGEELKRSRVMRLFIGGLATDYCVLHTVREARRLGYEVWLIQDAVRAVNVKPEDGEKAIRDMAERGANVYAGKVPR